MLAFFRWIDMHVDPDPELHVILDNLSAHKSQPVRDWLAHKKRRRWHLHFTPTSSSWLNLVECWFSVLGRNASTNTSFTSVAELELAGVRRGGPAGGAGDEVGLGVGGVAVDGGDLTHRVFGAV